MSDSRYVWMIYDVQGLARNKDYVSLYQKISGQYGIKVQVVMDTEVCLRVSEGAHPLCAFVRTIQPKINFFLEENGIPTFNSSVVSSLCNDKGKTLEYFKNQILSVPSVVVEPEESCQILHGDVSEIRTYFEKNIRYLTFEKQEREMAASAKDFVFKTVDGHGGTEVYSFAREQDKLISETRGKRLILQPMISGGSESRDVRVYVIGKRIFATVLRSSVCDFRANYSLGGTVKRYELTQEQKKSVRYIVEALDFGMAGIDFIIDDKEQFILNEIEDVVGARMLYRCAPELDIVQEFLRYVYQEKLHIV